MTRDEQLIKAALEMAADFIDSDDSILMSKRMMAGAIRAIAPADVLAKVAWRGPGEIAHRYSPDWMAQGDCQICGHTREAHQPAPDAVARLVEAALQVSLAYQGANPMRTADVHRPGCGCLRCGGRDG